MENKAGGEHFFIKDNRLNLEGFRQQVDVKSLSRPYALFDRAAEPSLPEQKQNRTNRQAKEDDDKLPEGLLDEIKEAVEYLDILTEGLDRLQGTYNNLQALLKVLETTR